MKDTAFHILVVEDESATRRLLRTMLEGEGYRVSEAQTSRAAMNALGVGDIDLVTLDVGLGREHGFEVARQIRRQSSVAIIMVTGKSADIDRIVGLEIGADDYITKPFNVREVLARVRAVLRRVGGKRGLDAVIDAQPLFHFDGFLCDPRARRVTRPDGDVIGLTSREFTLLEAFLRRPQRVLTRQVLMDLIGGQEIDTLERAVDTLVGRLRRKLTAVGPPLIQTVRGAGYIFTAKVKVLDDADESPPPNASSHGK